MPAGTRYLDFDLYLSREGDRYMAEVRNSPAGPSQRIALRWPFGTEPHEVLLLKLENAILKARGYRSGPLSSEEAILREFGSEIFRCVLRDSGAVATKFTSSLDIVQRSPDEGLRLKLHLEPPELAMLPWEYMFDESTIDADAPQNYLCLRNRSPVVRFVNVNPVNDLRVERPLRILGMIANPGSEEWPRLDAEVERDRIEQSLHDISKSAIHFEWVRGGRQDDLFDMMQHLPWHIFHFIGHGGTERYIDNAGQPRSQGFVVMQDGRGGSTRVSGSDLALALDDGVGHLRLAVLNCCDSGRGSSGFSSIGATLVASSTVPLAIAMQFAISNGAAARFAGMFYKTLVAGQPVERALTVARRFVRGQSTVEWGIPVLFTRSGSCVLFNIEPREDSGGTPVTPAASSSVAPDRRAEAREQLRRLFG